MARAIVLLDGGMGQELLKRTTRPPTPLWSAQILIDEPEIVEAVHLDFIEAGARVITINAYSATPERLARDADASLFEELQARAQSLANAARDKSGKPVTIAGCLPPLYASYRPDIAPSFEECLATYRRIVEAQKDAVDVFCCETMASLKEAKAALQAGQEGERPVWLGLTVDDADGTKLRSGEDLAEALEKLTPDKPDAILINCSVPEAIDQALPILAKSGVPFGAYANGFQSIAALEPGGTVSGLKQREDLGPSRYADFAMKWVEHGASVIGGCCEVGPAHIKEIATRLEDAGFKPKGMLP